MKIAVIGAGYVGLTTAACLSQIGHHVFCSESELDKLIKLQSGVLPIFEPGLEHIVADVRRSGRLVFGSTEDAVKWGEAIFICVGTPPLPDGDADLSAIEAVAGVIAKRAIGYKLIIEKSTVPVQTAARLKKYISMRATAGWDYDVASNPEFLREGRAVEDFLHPDRIVVGVDAPRAQEIFREIYSPIIAQEFACPVHIHCPMQRDVHFLVTDTRSAELIKHASNSFLATKISFINMVADLCELVGANVSEVSRGMGLDGRIGGAFLQAGLGFGGFCFPKDVQAFIRIAEKSGCDFSLLKEVDKINRHRIDRMMEKIRGELWVLRGKKIAVWGLAFKPNTDDVRYAPSLTIISSLLAEGAVVRAYDPKATDKARAVLPEVAYCSTPYESAEAADAVVIVTEWEEFRHVDWKRLRSIVEYPVIIDGRNILSPGEITRHGFHYASLGRPSLHANMSDTAPLKTCLVAAS